MLCRIIYLGSMGACPLEKISFFIRWHLRPVGNRKSRSVPFKVDMGLKMNLLCKYVVCILYQLVIAPTPK